MSEDVGLANLATEEIMAIKVRLSRRVSCRAQQRRRWLTRVCRLACRSPAFVYGGSSRMTLTIMCDRPRVSSSTGDVSRDHVSIKKLLVSFIWFFKAWWKCARITTTPTPQGVRRLLRRWTPSLRACCSVAPGQGRGGPPCVRKRQPCVARRASAQMITRAYHDNVAVVRLPRLFQQHLHNLGLDVLLDLRLCVASVGAEGSGTEREEP